MFAYILIKTSITPVEAIECIKIEIRALPTTNEDYLTKMEEIGGEASRTIDMFVTASKNYMLGPLAKSEYMITVEQAHSDSIAISISLVLVDAPPDYESGHNHMIDAIDHLMKTR